jgi:hypothetical protein
MAERLNQSKETDASLKASARCPDPYFKQDANQLAEWVQTPW